MPSTNCYEIANRETSRQFVLELLRSRHYPQNHEYLEKASPITSNFQTFNLNTVPKTVKSLVNHTKFLPFWENAGRLPR